MRLLRLDLENIGGFAALTMEFDARLTVLVGVNGSGKSTILAAIAQTLRATLDSSEGEMLSQRLRNGARAGRARLTGVHAGEERHASLAVVTRPDGRVVAEAEGGLLASAVPPLPIACLFPDRRIPIDRTPGSIDPAEWGAYSTYAHAFEATADFESLFHWFREREDVENALWRRDGSHSDPQLDAVRSAVERILGGADHGSPRFRDLHVRRPMNSPDEPPARRKPILEIEKDGTQLAFDQLSEGERTILAMAADIARRLAIANPGRPDPLEGTGVVLIDEIEIHLHPKWQSEVLDRLQRVFPNLQFVVSTHSPVVLAGVRAGQIRVLRDFELHSPAHPTRGRDADAILSEVFETPARPQWVLDSVSAIAVLLDAEQFDEARAKLEALAKELGDVDAEVTRLGMALELRAG